MKTAITFKRLVTIENAIVCLMLCVAVFCQSSSMYDSFIKPKWLYLYFWGGMALCVFGLKGLIKKDIYFNIKHFFYIISGVSFLEAVLGIYQFIQLYICTHSFLSVTGSFDNPAGFAISVCLGLPGLINILFNFDSKQIKLISLLFLVILLTAIILSHSRTGIMTFALLVVISNIYNKNFGAIVKYGLIITTLLLIGLSLYFINQFSVNGRFLIWLCAFNMFCDAPFFGHGIDSFRQKYMMYQADYFQNNTDSIYAQLADNVQQPYNEFINLILDFGLFGLILFGLFIYFFIYKNNKGLSLGNLTVLCLGSLSLTSYPFLYPGTWVVAGITILYAIRYDKFRKILKRNIYIALIAIGIPVALSSYNEIKTEQCRNIAIINDDIVLYKSLLPSSTNNPYFCVIMLYHCIIKI